MIPQECVQSLRHTVNLPMQRAARMSWARLLKRVFDIDMEHCPNCGGALKIIAAIEEPAVIRKILTHLGLPARACFRVRSCRSTSHQANTVYPVKDSPKQGTWAEIGLCVGGARRDEICRDTSTG